MNKAHKRVDITMMERRHVHVHYSYCRDYYLMHLIFISLPKNPMNVQTFQKPMFYKTLMIMTHI